MAITNEQRGMNGYQLPKATNKGIKPPSVTTTERLSMPAPSESSIVYDTDTKKVYCWDGTQWRALF